MDNFHKGWSRRKFIISTTGATIMLSPLFSWAQPGDDPLIAKIVASTIGVDTHNHIDVPINAAELPGPKVDLTGEMKKSGLSAICMTFAVDYQKLTVPGEAYDRFNNALAAMDELLKSNNMKRSLSFADLQAAHTGKQPTVVQSVEGSHFLEGKLERVEEAYKKGLRHLGLLHDSDASEPLGDIYTNPPRWGGLTVFGANVIKECNRLGLLVDLTHCSNETINAALKVATKPVIISHTGLDTQLGKNEFMAKMMRPRLISKEQAKIVAEAGGVIGVWTHLSDTPIEYAQNIRALVDAIGVDHVCIGTDTKMTPSYRSGGGPGNQKDGPTYENKSQNDPVNDKGRARIGERTNEAWQDQKVGFYYAVVGALLKTGFTEDEIRKIGGSNFSRVFDIATASR
jgi:membrane dipeptidase